MSSMVSTRRTYPPVSKKTRAKPFQRAGESSAATLTAREIIQAKPVERVAGLVEKGEKGAILVVIALFSWIIYFLASNLYQIEAINSENACSTGSAGALNGY